MEYDAAVNDALDRLVHAGFFFGGSNEFSGYAMHAPMGAEAIPTRAISRQPSMP